MKNILLYSTPTCVYCRMTKEFFVKNSVRFAEFNVAQDEKARAEMIGKSHQYGVPVVDVDGEIFVGFDRAGLTQALGIK